MGRIATFRADAGSLWIPAAEAALVSATLGLTAHSGDAERRLALVVKDAAFENPSDADFASYGETWFR